MGTCNIFDKEELRNAVIEELTDFISEANFFGEYHVAWLIVDPLNSSVYISRDKEETYGFVSSYYVYDFIKFNNDIYELDITEINKKFPLDYDDFLI